ncbi:MAG: LysM peptidoglycan-binding domain-containing protein [Bacteroidales bacterium]
MGKIKSLFLLIAIWSISALTAQELPYKKEVKEGKEFYIYQVESGEGLYSVCRKFNITQDEILKYNKDAENGLHNGQVLRIPTKKAAAKVDDSSYFYHTIDQGETVGSIAMMYGVSVSSIRKLNIDIDKTFKIGFALKIPQTVRPQVAAATENYQYHTIAPHETLYSLSVKYNVSTQDILSVNPGLTAASFKIGKVVRIDVSKVKKGESAKANDIEVDNNYIRYIVRNNESVFSISRKFNISVDSLLVLNPALRSGVHSGLIVRVPMPKTAAKEQDTEDDAKVGTQPKTTDDDIQGVTNGEGVKVALMLPFMLDETGEEAAKQSRRFIEYYEGLLLAVEKLKNEGISIDLQVFDTGSETKSIAKTLHQPSLANVQLIIGPVYNEHIAQVSKFAKEKNIALVIPFTSKNDEVLTNPNVLQLNTPHSYLYSAAAQMFCKKFKKHQIIFVEEANKVGDKADFIAVLKAELKRRSMVYKTFTAKNDDDFENVATMLSPAQENVVVPTSGNFNELKQIVPSLQGIVVANPALKLSLFGYPEWQTYVKEYLDAFHNLNTYIYSTFFANPMSPNYKEFANQFHGWYQREIINSYPKYGILGYDMGIYFLKTLATTGNNFDKTVSKKSYHGIQTGFSFERVNNWGGLINKNVYLINYAPNFEITKLMSDK